MASLAGYILRADGRAPVVFALVANDVNDVPGARMAFDAFVRGVAAQADGKGDAVANAALPAQGPTAEEGVAPRADLAR